MYRFFVLAIMVAMVFSLASCEKTNAPLFRDVVDVIDDEDLPMPPPIIERSHIYESDQLAVLLPFYGADMVKLVGSLADEMGNPEEVLLTVQNGSLIERNPDWFERNVERFFLILVDGQGAGGTLYDFYWVAPDYSISEHIKEFKKLPPPSILGTEVNVTNSLSILFEASREVMYFPGLEHRTRVNGVAYTQWAVWAGESDDVWDVTFGEHGPGQSAVDISHVIMTEFGDYEIRGEGIDIPYGDIGVPYNFIE